MTEEFAPNERKSFWQSRLQAIDWSVVLLVLAVKALVFLFAILSFDSRASLPEHWMEMWNRWDSLHYQAIAEHGYSGAGEARVQLAFFPLYPWLVRLIAHACGNYLLAALLVSGAASVVAALLLKRLARLDDSPEIAHEAVWFLLIFPTSFFLHISYTESLFLALVLGSILAARLDQWAVAGVVGAAACATRLNGCVLIPVLMVEAWQQWRTTRRINPRWLWIGAAAGGLGIYLLINYRVTGDAFAFLRIQEGHWYKKIRPPWIGVGDIWLRAVGANFMEGLQEFLFAMLGLVAIVWCWLKSRPSYALWMTGNWLLFMSTSFVLSVPRYTLMFFPLFILFARLATARAWMQRVLTVWSLLFLGFFVSRFVRGHWAF